MALNRRLERVEQAVDELRVDRMARLLVAERRIPYDQAAHAARETLAADRRLRARLGRAPTLPEYIDEMARATGISAEQLAAVHRRIAGGEDPDAAADAELGPPEPPVRERLAEKVDQLGQLVAGRADG